MNTRTLIAPIILLALCAAQGCMKMDGFLFESEKIDHYALPGNTIPDSLIEPVTLASDGNNIHGYWVRSSGGRPGTTILYCHGNRNNLDYYWDRVIYLHRLGVNVFVFDYRGYGLSEGESSEQGLMADGEAALDYVMRSRSVPADSLVLYGFSLGNVVSIHLAAEKVRPRVLIAEAPFASANSLTQGATGLDIPPRWLTEGTFDNAAAIRKVTAPLLLLHGDADDFVRYRDNGRVVYEAANDPKHLELVQGAGHSTIPETMGVEKYLDVVGGWIAGH